MDSKRKERAESLTYVAAAWISTFGASFSGGFSIFYIL